MAASHSNSAMSNPRPMVAPAPCPRATHHGALHPAPSAAVHWTWETLVGATGMLGAWEEPGPGGATLYMGGCWELGAGAWGAVQSGWRRVWCDRKGSLSCPEEGAVPLLGPGGSTQPGWAARPWAPLCFLSSVPQAPQVLGGTASPFLGFGLQTKGTGPTNRCSEPPRQGLQPPRGSLVSIYNKIVGDTSV